MHQNISHKTLTDHELMLFNRINLALETGASLSVYLFGLHAHIHHISVIVSYLSVSADEAMYAEFTYENSIAEYVLPISATMLEIWNSTLLQQGSSS